LSKYAFVGGVLVVTIIGVAVILPLFTAVLNEINVTGGDIGGSTVNALVGFLPVCVVIVVILSVVGMVAGGSGDYVSDEEDDPEEPDDIPETHDYKKERVFAEELLRRRYARGEISSEEFTERMSHL
jgi:uncharacterized membrane protein